MKQYASKQFRAKQFSNKQFNKFISIVIITPARRVLQIYSEVREWLVSPRY